MANPRATGKKPRITSRKTKEARQKFTEIMQKLEHERPEVFEQAFLEGLAAPPPASFQYLQMWAHYRQGKPVDRMELKAQHQTVARVVHEHLPALPEPEIIEGQRVRDTPELPVAPRTVHPEDTPDEVQNALQPAKSHDDTTDAD